MTKAIYELGIPPPNGDWVPVYSPKVGKPLDVYACGPVQGVLTHFAGNRSWPCGGQQCTHPLHPMQPARWKGYMPARTMRGRKCVVEVTLGASRTLPLVLRPEVIGEPLRFVRTGGIQNSPVRIERIEYRDRLTTASPFEIRDVLDRMWGLTGTECNEEVERCRDDPKRSGTPS